MSRTSSDAEIELDDPGYLALIRSDRVSAPLREELLRRARTDDPGYGPRAMTAAQFGILRALVDRVIPQDGPVRIDLAARLDAVMAEAAGNGWRHESLPADPDACRQGLDTLDAIARGRHGGRRFAALAGGEQDRILEDVAAAERPSPPDAPLDAAQMALWFEDLRSDAVRFYVAHPATMARLGYSGIANGAGSGADFAGFTRIGVGEREPFEPAGRAETLA